MEVFRKSETRRDSERRESETRQSESSVAIYEMQKALAVYLTIIAAKDFNVSTATTTKNIFFYFITEPRCVGLDGTPLLLDEPNRGSPGLLRKNAGLYDRSRRYACYLSEIGVDLSRKGRGKIRFNNPVFYKSELGPNACPEFTGSVFSFWIL